MLGTLRQGFITPRSVHQIIPRNIIILLLYQKHFMLLDLHIIKIYFYIHTTHYYLVEVVQYCFLSQISLEKNSEM